MTRGKGRTVRNGTASKPTLRRRGDLQWETDSNGETDVAEPVLLRWSIDPDFWIRRASMLSLLPALRAGGGDFDLFASFASRMVSEKEFFIRKAIGWVLRDVSKKRPQLAYDFLDLHLNEVSGLTFREGSKYLPSEMRDELRSRR